MALSTTGYDPNWLVSLRRVWEKAIWGRTTAGMPLPIALNNENVTALNAAGTGTVALIKATSGDAVQLPTGASVPTGQTLTIASGATLAVSGSVTGITSYLSTATVNLTAAQIISLHSVPVTLIATPGSGKALVVHGLLLEMTTTSTGFTGGGVIAPVYHLATAALTGNTIPASVVNAGAGTSYTLISIGAQASGLTLSANTGVDLYAASSDFATGTGTAVVQVWYSVITL